MSVPQEELLSVFEIAKRLKLHVKTVRNYVREGKLKAVRVGKQYRISRADVEAFTGFPLPLTERERARRQREVGVSCVVRVDAISPEASRRIESSLAAFVNRDRIGEEPLRADTIYDREIGHLEIMLFGGVNSTASALKLIAALLEQ
ncbi:MAG TPA: helix-turn-helix domain-containing protein [Gammaproteobacteria bacterium]|nr:helix-turn-helix domain-containing protein [Gammaproteobacteria bacterium]